MAHKCQNRRCYASVYYLEVTVTLCYLPYHDGNGKKGGHN